MVTIFARLCIWQYIAIIWITLPACNKFLDVKPSQSLVVPRTLSDLQALLDDHNLINERSPIMNELASDDYYVTTADYQARALAERQNYIWDKNATFVDSWNTAYRHPVYYSNVVLDQLSSVGVSAGERNTYNAIKGTALFHRAFAFYQLAQLYCKPYSTSAKEEEGIVLRLSGDINVPSVRSTVEQTYSQILDDLKVAAELLPINVIFPTRPNRASAFGALARTYLSMRHYEEAGQYADSCLQLHDTLMDFSKLVPVAGAPIPRFNCETIFYNRPFTVPILSNSRAKVDSNLYNSYDPNDLRKTVYFKTNTGAKAGTYGFQGSYDGTSSPGSPFYGITSDEMYLIRAEVNARSGKITEAMKDLNILLETRWAKGGSWLPLTASTKEGALQKILEERRKELIFRGSRWTDVRRLNLEGAGISFNRIIDGVTYTLPPLDDRWVLLIPQEVISLTGIKQNQRSK